MTDPRPQHDAAVSGMFGRIAGFYDLLNHTLSLGIDYYWRHVLAKNVRVGSTNRVLDLAAGTLDAFRSLLGISSRYWNLDEFNFTS